MKNHSAAVLAALLLIAPLQSFADSFDSGLLNRDRQDALQDFKTEVQNQHDLGALRARVVAKGVSACMIGGIFTGLAAIADTFPLSAGVGDIIAISSVNCSGDNWSSPDCAVSDRDDYDSEGLKPWVGLGAVSGGGLSVAIDRGRSIMQSKKTSDLDYSFTHEAYFPTELSYQRHLGEDSACGLMGAKLSMINQAENFVKPQQALDSALSASRNFSGWAK